MGGHEIEIGVINENSKMQLDLCEENNLVEKRNLFSHNDVYKVTCILPDKKLLLTLVILLLIKYGETVCQIHGNDHYLLIAKIKLSLAAHKLKAIFTEKKR